ncbi:uncharacterized protein LOC116306353 [Actinia tenebrosa]|uniref:Uncharacterized protein LOC116306353 n=1 Tax=Actinia tenebrosa TaxID=6105 RepID=A0A6P8IYL0_ACTTE|nr:uncharacterized protein LOC116306353 [Actinia tenebrosa]
MSPFQFIPDAQSKTPSKMEWNEEKNILLIREVLNVEPYNAKERTTQRAQLWQQVADNLNNHHSPKFKVDKRAVRDHLNMIIEKFKKKMKNEESTSGISPELTELDALLEEVIGRIEVANEVVQVEKDKTKEKMEKEKKEAEDVRLKAMEKLAELRLRKKVGMKNQKRKSVNGEDQMELIL